MKTLALLWTISAILILAGEFEHHRSGVITLAAWVIGMAVFYAIELKRGR